MKKEIWKNRWFAVWYFYHPEINRGVGIDFLVRDGSGGTSHGYAYYFGL